jgi:hypothetical protein
MRTTVEIDDDLIKRLREQAHRDGTSLREKLNAALHKGLSAGGRVRTSRRYKCPSLAMGHPVAPTIDLDKALAISGALEDAEVARELELGK